MSVPTMEPERLAHFKLFVEICKANPSILHRPDLAFVKSFIEYFNGKIPEENTDNSEKSKDENECKTEEPKVEAKDNVEESDFLDLDTTEVISDVDDVPQMMGNPTLQPTEEEIAESQTKRSEAVSAVFENDYEKAIDLYTEAIQLNPQMALLNAKRGQIYLLLNKPNACIRDCNRALELNPDSAMAHKFRGRAYYLLGKWVEAVNDLRLACMYDFDEEANEWLRKATNNAAKIEEHKRKKEREDQEKMGQSKNEDTQKAKDTAKMREDFYKVFKNPLIVETLLDPEINEAFKEISSNPASIFKYQKNPKIAAFFEEMSKIYDLGSSGMSNFAGMMGSMPGFFGTNAPPRSDPPKSPQPEDDVGLD